MNEITKVDEALKDAIKYEQVGRVVYFALQYMKDHPTKTIDDALRYGNYVVFEQVYHVGESDHPYAKED